MARQKAKVEKEIDINKIDEEISKAEEVKKVEEVKDERPLGEKIESARSEFFTAYMKNRKMSNISMGVTVLLVIAAFILITLKELPYKITGWVIAGLTVVGAIVFYALNHKKIPNKLVDYKNYVVKTFNEYCYRESEYSDVKSDPDERIEASDLISDKVYLDLSKTASRNVIHGSFNSMSFMCADVAVYNSNPKEKMPMFVGKYLSSNNDLHFEGRYILVNQMKPVNPESEEAANPNLKPCDLPTDIEDLVLLVDEETFKIYGPEGANPNKDLGKDFIANIKKMIPDGNLLNLNVVVWAGHTAGYMSYGDPVIALPFDHEFVGEPMEKFDKDQYKLLGNFVALCEKEK